MWIIEAGPELDEETSWRGVFQVRVCCVDYEEDFVKCGSAFVTKLCSEKRFSRSISVSFGGSRRVPPLDFSR